MPITDLQLITVTGKYLRLDGTPASGTVTFTPSTVIINTVANEIVYPNAFVITLSSSGTFTVSLPATNDPDLNPTGWVYSVTENIVGSTIAGRTFNIALPYDMAGSTIDMADILPAVAGIEYAGYALVSHRHEIFTPSSATAVGLIIKGLVSQSGDLQQWQDSTGANKLRVTYDGSIVMGVPWTVVGLNAPQSYIQGSVASYVVSTVRGAASQTGDLQRWDNSAGTRLLSVAADGTLLYGAGATTSYLFSPTAVEGSRLQATSAARIPLVVKGFASQTADLQQWQNSAATVLARMQFDGLFAEGTAYPNYIFNPDASAGATKVLITPQVAASKGLTVQGRASQTGDLQQWQDSAGAVLARVLTGGGVRTSTVGDVAGTGPYIAFNPSTLIVVARAATQVAMMVQGAASQTADLQQWQNDAGTVLASIGSTGRVRGGMFDSVAGTGPNLTPSSTTMTFTSRGTTQVPLTIRGIASQTADLQQWQDSALAVRVAIDAAGAIWSPATSTGNNSFNGAQVANQTVTAYSAGTTRVPLVAKGVASQTADLQQWQNDAGTILGRVGSNGVLNSTLGGILGKATTTLHALGSSVGLDVYGTGAATYAAINYINESTSSSAGLVMQFILLDTGGGALRAGALEVIKNGAWTAADNTTKNADIRFRTIFQGTVSEAMQITASGVPKWSRATNVQTTVGAAGGASTLPGAPTKYLKVQDDLGNVLVVPAYAAS